jgi:hypothetical protein
MREPEVAPVPVPAMGNKDFGGMNFQGIDDLLSMDSPS